ncbi:MAG: glutathione S-transferase [Panacagrimonas sp.]
MITVHHLNNSRSQRVLWLLEELGVPYEVKRYERDAGTMLAPPELKRVHPLGKSPVIADGEVTVAESGAISDYLVERYGAGRLVPPTGSTEHLRYTYWMHYAEGSLMGLLVMKLILSKVPAKVPFLVRPVARAIVRGVGDAYLDPTLQTHLSFIESELGRSIWFAGAELTAADVQMSFALQAVSARVGGGALPRIAEFVKRIEARPAYKRALEKGGPFALMS